MVNIRLHPTFNNSLRLALESSIKCLPHFITFIAFIFCVHFLIPTALASPSSPSPNILHGKNALILVSPGYGLPGVDLYVSTLLKNLNNNGFLLNDIHVEFLDLDRYSEKVDRQRLATTLQHKYAETDIDLLFCIMQPALNFFLNEVKNLAPQAPVLCSFATMPTYLNPSDTRRYVLQTASWDFSGTMKIAIQLFPRTQRVFVIQGNSENELANLDVKRRQFEPWQEKLQIDDTQDLSVDEIEAKFATAPTNTIIIGAGIIRDAKGQVFVPVEFMRRIAKTAKAPIFVLNSNNIGHGTIGGSVSRFDDEAFALSTMGIDILRGSIELTERITIIPGIKTPTFDWQQLKRWDANTSDLPTNSIFINRPVTLWGQYKITVIAWVICCLCLIACVVLLSLMNRRQKLTNIALQESRNQYLNLVEDTPDLIIRVDTEWRILFVNHAALKFLGLPAEECLGRLTFDFIHPKDLPATHDVLQEWFKSDDGNNTLTLENRLISYHESVHYMTWVIRAEYNENDEISGFASTARNITKRKQAEEERRSLADQLQQAQKMESIGNLAGGIAHDFNNILAVTLGYTELALDTVEKGTPIQEDLQEVYTANLRAKELVNQILAFARQSDEKHTPIQIRFIIKEVIKFIRSSTPTTIEIKQNIESDSSIIGNATQIHQIMMNLCTNAAHAMETKGGTLEITSKDTTINNATLTGTHNLSSGNYIEIKVADTGSGIDPEIINKIYEPYFTTKKPGEGTGMGLAMVYGIVETYGGKINVESTVGKGTTFTIYFPVTKESKAHQEYKVKELPTGQERILLVDDEPQLVKVTSRVLGQLGYFVTTSTSSVEALELFRSKPNDYDLVISDVTMPKMNGDQLSKYLIEIRPDIPIILCTGYSKTLSEDKALELGIKAFTHKPIVKEDLAETVRDVLDLAKNQSLFI